MMRRHLLPPRHKTVTDLGARLVNIKTYNM